MADRFEGFFFNYEVSLWLLLFKDGLEAGVVYHFSRSSFCQRFDWIRRSY